MYVVACSWRVVTKRIDGSPWSASSTCIRWVPGMPNTTSTPSAFNWATSRSLPLISAIIAMMTSAQCRRADRGGERVDLVDQVRGQRDPVAQALLASLGLEHPRHDDAPDPLGAIR